LPMADGQTIGKLRLPMPPSTIDSYLTVNDAARR